MKSTSSDTRYRPPTPLSAGQTILWFLAGISAMFLLVSAIFAAKLAAEGRLQFFSKQSTGTSSGAPAKAAEAVTPPVSAAAVTGGSKGDFLSGAENILPPEAAHLARVDIAAAAQTASPPAQPASAPTPPVAAPTPPVAAADAAAPKPAVATPAAASPATPVNVAPTSGSDAIAAAIKDWVGAWQRKDVEAYLKHYADDFQPANGLKYAAWISQRKQRLSRPGDISIQISGLDITATGDKATARFTQGYRAGAQALSETKTIELVQRKGNWLIQQERIGS